jgi:hypothetical protein
LEASAALAGAARDDAVITRLVIHQTGMRHEYAEEQSRRGVQRNRALERSYTLVFAHLCHKKNESKAIGTQLDFSLKKSAGNVGQFLAIFQKLAALFSRKSSARVHMAFIC